MNIKDIKRTLVLCDWVIEEYSVNRVFLCRIGDKYIPEQKVIDDDDIDEWVHFEPWFDVLTNKVDNAYKADSLQRAKDTISQYIHFWNCKMETKPTKTHKLC